LAVAGVALAARRDLSSGIILGCGLVLAGCAKPPAAIALTVVFGTLALWLSGRKLRLLAGLFMGSVIAVSALLGLMGLSPMRLVDYLRGGLELEWENGAHGSVRILLGLAPVDLSGLVLVDDG
jgi:hypothetical protein